MTLVEPTLLPVLVRMIAAATVVVATSIASERAGPFWGAIIVSLPVSAGPAYVLLALAQDADFIAASALMSLAMHAAAAAYLLVYAHVAQRFGTLPSVAAALATWFVGVLLIHAVPWTAGMAVAENVVAFALCLYLTRGIKHPPSVAPRAVRRWYDLPLRAGAIAVLVASVVTLSGTLGPTVTGIAAVFPIAVTSACLTLQPRLGGPATGAIMANALQAMPGMGAGFLVLHLTAPQIGSAAALTLALLISVSWPLTLVALRARRERRARMQRAY